MRDEPARWRAMGAVRSLALVVACTVVGPSVARAGFDDEPLDYGLDGYWSARYLRIGNLFLGQGENADIGRPPRLFENAEGRLRGLEDTSYLLHQMRASPHIAYRDIAHLRLDVDILDGVVWGDNEGLASLALFAGSPSATGVDGQPLDTISIRRAWLEVNLPVGQLRVGRMPSHWGMGLLANKGDGLDADFGDYHAGSVVDRILFATRPVQLVQTLMGVENPEKKLGGKITLALAFDKTVSLAVDSDPESTTNRELACTACPPQILLSRPNDDVDQYVGVLLYKDEKADLWELDDQITAGVYVVHRAQKDTQSKVWIIDGYLKLRIGPVGLETEMISITGTTNAIDSPDNPLNIDIKVGVVRVGWYGLLDQLEIELEAGYAPGDTSATSGDFTGFPIHPDFNVGLILYDYVLATYTAAGWGQEQRGLWSKGGVWNSVYVQPKIRWRPPWVEGLTVIGAFLWAKADTRSNGVWFGPPEVTDDDLVLGKELDLAVRYDFFSHLHAKLETGVFFPDRALWKDVYPPFPADPDNQITGDDQADPAWTLQLRLGFVL